MADNPVCIRRTSTVEEADIIVAWLAEQGVEAFIPDHENPGVLAFGLTDREGVEIFVPDQAKGDRAKALLEEHDQQHAGNPTASGHAAITVTCDECHEDSTFPAEQADTVQECAQCGAHLDVPKS